MRQFLIKIENIKQHVLTSTVLMAIVVLTATVFPRVMLIGGFPATDEGIYAYQGQLIHASLSAGKGLPGVGGLALYPMLLSWVFGLTINHLVMLRLADMIVAVAASCLLYRVIERESGSLVGGALISLVALFTMNQEIFIQCGFKNSMFAAYVPLFLALRLGQDRASETRSTWVLIGTLAALAVLLRETFFYFMIIGGLAVWMAHGWRACLRFTLGAAVAGLLVTLGIAVARGGIANLIDSYRAAGSIYAASADRRLQLFIYSGTLSLKEAAVALVLGGLGIIAIVAGFFARNRSVSPKRFAFWVSVTLVPLLEPASKIGYPYHFAVCLPGIAGLTALGWKSLAVDGSRSLKLRFATIAAIAGVLILLPKFASLTDDWPDTLDVLQNAGTGSWPADLTEWSNYLLAAEAISKAAPPNGTLSVSGFMYTLYPLTGLLPPSKDLSNLTVTLAVICNLDSVCFKHALLACPPDVLMTTTRNVWPGREILTKVVEDSGLYEQVENIPETDDKSYGDFGGVVYKKIKQVQDRGKFVCA
ncbi:MAG: hypothetical protein WBQ69_07255 [Gallionella sp.]